MKTFPLFLLGTILFLGASSAQTPYLEPGLSAGPYQVGFKVFREYDYSRTLPDSLSPYTKTRVKNLARPVQISVWYPAQVQAKLSPMPYSRYIHLMATERDFDYTGDPMQHPFVVSRLLEDSFIRKEQVDLALKARSKAVENAAPLAGSFPVVVYSPGGFGSNFENATLFEYLASHGFIVASYPSTEIDQTPADKKGQLGPWVFEPHARDLEFVIAFMRTIPNVDMERLGIAGYSLGGSSVVTVLSRNIAVKAAVSLDGWHQPFNFQWMPFVDLNRIRVPFMNLARAEPEGNPNRIVYDSLRGQDAYLVTFNTIGHTFFGSSWILLSDHASSDWAAVKGTQAEINTGYALLSDYVLHFFKAYLLGDAASAGLLKTLHQRNGLPAGFLTVAYKTGGKTAAEACMDQVIALDDSLGKVRNHACKTIPLSETVRQYVRAMERIDYSNCPGAFVTAFEQHREAWLALLPVTDKYPDLRGEMHDLFKQLETGRDAVAFKPLVKAIWDTWAEVENAIKK